MTLWWVAGPSLGAFSAQMVSRPTTGSADFLYSHRYPSATSGPETCTSVPAVGNITNAIEAVSCPASMYPTTSSGTASDALTAVGNVPARAVNEQISVTSCGPVQLADSAGGDADPLLAHGDITFGEPGPLAGGNAIGLDGTTAFAADVQAASSASLLGTSFTEGVWFKVPSGYDKGGVLIGFGSSPTDGPESSYDRVIWMTTSGELKFAIDGTLGTTDVVTAPGTYNDGQWHLAVVATTSVVASIPTLYVSSGTAVSSATGVGISALADYTGYWHVGWDQLSPQWDSTASPFLTGDLADAFVVAGTALSPSEVSTLAAETTEGGWAAEVALLGSAHSWTLGDSGTTTYGATPYGLSNAVCSYVDIAWSFANPSASIPATALSAFASGPGHTVAAPPAGTTQTIAVTLTHDATYTGAAAADLPGLVIYAPVSISLAVGSSPWRSDFTWAAALTSSTAASTFLM